MRRKYYKQFNTALVKDLSNISQVSETTIKTRIKEILDKLEPSDVIGTVQNNSS